MKSRSGIVKLVLRIAAVVVLLGQFVRPERTNPVVDPGMTVQASLEVPVQVEDILSRACNDCHSNETAWPWYASVAPASWLCVKDANEGRRHLNFSEWGHYPPGNAARPREPDRS